MQSRSPAAAAHMPRPAACKPFHGTHPAHGAPKAHALLPRRTGGCSAAALRSRAHRPVVVASGESLEASFGTGGGDGRTGAAQLQDEPAEAGQSPLDAAAAPDAGAEVLRETAEYMRGELRRIFSTGVSHC